MGSFEVMQGGLLDIDAAVYGPANEVHFSAQRQKTGSFNLLAPSAGLYRLCFSNRMSTMAEKSVAFSLHLGDELFQDIARLGACELRVARAPCVGAVSRRMTVPSPDRWRGPHACGMLVAHILTFVHYLRWFGLGSGSLTPLCVCRNPSPRRANHAARA